MGKNKIGMILIIVLLIVLLLTIGIGFFFIFKNLNSDTTEASNIIVTENSIDINDIYLFEIEDSIYTNLMVGEDNKEHVIKLSLNLGIDYSGKNTKESDALTTTLTEKIPVIKDSVIGILRSKTYEELIRVDTQALLKEEILSSLQEVFNTDLIAKVYINDLILQ